MTFDLISGLHMQIQTWHPPLWLCTHAKYYVKSGLTNVLKNANKTKNMHLFSIRIANYEIKTIGGGIRVPWTLFLVKNDLEHYLSMHWVQSIICEYNDDNCFWQVISVIVRQ